MLRKYLPKSVNNKLFGNRELYGKEIWKDDTDWKKWNEYWVPIYEETQHSGFLQKTIIHAGYKILNKISVHNKNITEIGAGGGYHFHLFQGTPQSYTAIDVSSAYFPKIKDYFSKKSIVNCKLVQPYSPEIDLPSYSQDVVVSFYSLEHLHPFDQWLDEIFRVLKPGGKLVGAIPAEGGIFWGLGRWFTSRKTLKKYGLKMEKILCWSHPNTCDEIITALNKRNAFVQLSMWPLPFVYPDFSLVIKFIVSKKF